MDPAERLYSKKRIEHWNRVVQKKENKKRPGAYYQDILENYYKHLIPPGLKILELGSGLGDLLATLQPSFGVGIDFSKEMVKRASKRYPELNFIQSDVHEISLTEKFDIIILSDLINDLYDVQTVFETMRHFSHNRTRVVLNFFNNLWRIPLGMAKRLGLGADLLEQNWFSPNDIINLLQLTGFEVVNRHAKIFLPYKIPFLTQALNSYVAHFAPFKWFDFSNVIIARSISSEQELERRELPSVSVVIAARNESGNIDNIMKRVPELGSGTEIVFVEGHSTDNTYEAVEKAIKMNPEKKCRLFRQPGKGKGDAIRLGFEMAEGDILLILDADLTVPPEDLSRFVEALISGKGEFINGVRLVYPMEDKAMRFFNILGNKFFSLAFTWLLGQPIKDTLCGTKVLYKKDYELIANNRSYFGDFDPFGDFDLLFGAARLNIKITELPIRYRERKYGSTNISRWKHGWLLLKMVIFAAKRIKFI